MEIDFLYKNMGEFWGYVGLLLKGIQPGIMLAFAVVAVGLILGIIISTWKRSARDLEKEEDYEYKEY